MSLGEGESRCLWVLHRVQSEFESPAKVVQRHIANINLICAADAKFPGRIDKALPPSPSRENPGQVSLPSMASRILSDLPTDNIVGVPEIGSRWYVSLCCQHLRVSLTPGLKCSRTCKFCTRNRVSAYPPLSDWESLPLCKCPRETRPLAQ